MPVAPECEPLDMLTLQDFQSHLDAPFASTDEALQTSPFFLTEARGLGQAATPEAQTPFSLLFRNAASVPQGIHALIHPLLGQVDIFLVPVARDGDATLYQAVFN